MWFATVTTMIILSIYGWFLNIFWLIGETGEKTGEFWVSIIGAFMVPLGGLMGYLH